MPKTNPHRATLHNLSLLLLRCQLLDTPYLLCFYELADGMGFDALEAEAVLLSANGAEYHLPNAPHERDFELRMGISLIVRETPLPENQRQILLEFAEKLHLSAELVIALEEVNIRKNMQHFHHLLMFKNLYAALRLSHEITLEQEIMLDEVGLALGISAETIDELNAGPIPDFSVPEEVEERLFTIKNMILLLMTGNGEDPGMFAAILRYTLKAGFLLPDLELWLEENKTLIREQALELEETTHHNLSFYLQVFEKTEELPWDMPTLATWMKAVLKNRQLPAWPFSNPQQNKTLADLLWIVAVRAVRLDHHMVVMGPVYLEMMAESQQLAALSTPLLELESGMGGNLIALPSVPIEAVEEEIVSFFQALEW